MSDTHPVCIDANEVAPDRTLIDAAVGLQNANRELRENVNGPGPWLPKLLWAFEDYPAAFRATWRDELEWDAARQHKYRAVTMLDRSGPDDIAIPMRIIGHLSRLQSAAAHLADSATSTVLRSRIEAVLSLHCHTVLKSPGDEKEPWYGHYLPIDEHLVDSLIATVKDVHQERTPGSLGADPSSTNMERVRRAVKELGEDAKADAIRRRAQMNKKTCNDCLRTLQSRGEYSGFSRDRPGCYKR